MYEGEFKKGLFSGEGVLKFSSGTVFSGEFKKGKMKKGRGEFYEEGELHRVYEGKFKRNRPWGKGKMVWV